MHQLERRLRLQKDTLSVPCLINPDQVSLSRRHQHAINVLEEAF